MRFAFLDESGDLEFNVNRISEGATDSFAMAMLFTDDPVAIYSMVDALKDCFGMRRMEEFTFSKTSPERRITFLEELRRHDIVIRAMVLNKAAMAGLPIATEERLVYRDLVRRTIIRHRDEFDQTKIILDEYIRGKKAQLQFNSWLRNCVNTESRRCLSDISHVKSDTNNVIQAVDMVVGAIRRSRSIGDDQYLRIIQPRVREVWDWDGVEIPGEPETLQGLIPEPPKRKKRRN